MENNAILELIKNEFYRIKPKGCWDFFKQRDKRIPCLPVLQKKFSMTYNQILIKAGLSEKELNFVRRDIQETIEALKKLTDELGHVPSASEFREKAYSPELLMKHFGSYNNALKILNLRGANKTPDVVSESKDELLKMYIDFSNKLGKPASCIDLDLSNSTYNSSVFGIRFGGMYELKREAGFVPIIRNKVKYNKSEVNKKLKDLFMKNNGRLKFREIDNIPGLPSISTILKLYKTTKMETVWSEIEREIKFDKAS